MLFNGSNNFQVNEEIDVSVTLLFQGPVDIHGSGISCPLLPSGLCPHPSLHDFPPRPQEPTELSIRVCPTETLIYPGCAYLIVCGACFTFKV